jgi:hypothetical protein
MKMIWSIEGLAYLTAGAVLMYLYVSRSKGVETLSPEKLPELGSESFAELKNVLKEVYKRTLYLAVAFLYLAYVTIAARPPAARMFGLILAFALFIYCIPPRNRVMKILSGAGLDRKDIRDRGLSL